VADYHDEQQQLEALKRWWQDNRNHVIAGLVIGAAAVGGWRFWQDYERRKSEEGSALYSQLVDAVEKQDMEQADALGKALVADYARTPYAAQGALALAKGAVDAGDLAKAATQLEWAAAHAGDPELETVAKLRLARVKLAQGEAEAALAILGALVPGKFTVLVEDVRGDAELALGRIAEARKAYAAALAAFDADPDAGVGDRSLIQMKLDELPAAEAGQ
jgi:predicted negative regulator of RcsB-dependent stress response